MKVKKIAAECYKWYWRSDTWKAGRARDLSSAFEDDDYKKSLVFLEEKIR